MEFTEILERFGLPIAFLVVIVLGQFVPGFVYKERKSEVEEANAEIRRLNDFVISEVIPALSRQADVVEEAMQLLAQMQNEQEIQARLRELGRHQSSDSQGTG